MAALLPLLEQRTAAKFHDQYYNQDAVFDASHISFLATGNRLETISAPLLSRFNSVMVEPPTNAQKRVIVNSIYKRTLDWHQIGQKLAEKVPQTVVDFLIEYEPRQIRQLLESGIGVQIGNNARELTLECFSPHIVKQLNKHKKQRIGF